MVKIKLKYITFDSVKNKVNYKLFFNFIYCEIIEF